MHYLYIIIELITSFSLCAQVTSSCECFNGTLCEDTEWTLLKNDLYWAWASETSGGGSSGSQLIDPIPYGWRRATDEEFGVNGTNAPTLSEWLCVTLTTPGAGCTADGEEGRNVLCAANVFTISSSSCSVSDYEKGFFTNINNGGLWETVLVRKCPTINPTINPTADTSYPTRIPTRDPTSDPTYSETTTMPTQSPTRKVKPKNPKNPKKPKKPKNPKNPKKPKKPKQKNPKKQKNFYGALMAENAFDNGYIDNDDTIIVNLSDKSIFILWGLFGAFTIFNIIAFWCYYKHNSNKVKFVVQDAPNIDV